MSSDGHADRTREDEYPAINMSRIRVGGDLGGVIFVVGTVVCVLLGLPEARGFFVGTLAGGCVTAVLIFWWHRRRHGRGGDDLTFLRLGRHPDEKP